MNELFGKLDLKSIKTVSLYINLESVLNYLLRENFEDMLTTATVQERTDNTKAFIANIINLSSSIFESAKCTALFIDKNANIPTKGASWYVRDDGQHTNALKARILGAEQPNPEIKDREAYFNYNYLGGINADDYVGGRIDCITAICDAVYTDDATAREFLSFIDDSIENVSDRISLIGAYMNRVESAVDAIGVQKENIVSANSSIKDADVATESSNFIEYQILQQATATLLSTANQTPSIALNLI